MPAGRARLSLKGRALKYLAQREHSRLELRRKLLPYAIEEACARREAAKPACSAAVGRVGSQVEVRGDLEADDASMAELSGALADELSAELSTEEAGPCLDKLLDWLEAHGLLSQERFTESKVRTRAPRFGLSRIGHELSQHGLSLAPEQRAQLQDTEFARAFEVWRRKFGARAGEPRDEKEKARQIRFLQARGFSADAVRRVIRGETPYSP